MTEWTGRLLSAILVIGLVSASTTLAIVVGSPGPVRVSTRTVTVTEHIHISSTSGILVLNALASYAPDPEPVLIKSFTVFGKSGLVGSPNSNGSGYSAMPLEPGFYVLRINDLKFNLSIPFQILRGNLTVVTLLMTKHAAVPYFAGVSDEDFSGWVAKGNSFLVELSLPNVLVHANDQAFIEVRGSSGYSEIHPNVAGRAVVTQVSVRGGITFLQLRALQQFEVANLARSRIVVYDPLYSVRIISLSS